MPASHSQENAELILALSKMGIYMERDRKQLDTMSASAQNARLKKALDRAVENCCIFPLLFTKEQREMGELVVSGLPEWEGWRDPAKVPVIHFLDRPSSCSILLQKQTGVVGTSVVMMPNGRFPGMNIDNTAIFDAIVSIIKRSEKDKAEAAYFWATRKGDCLEVDLLDLPDQSLGW
ncbi:hypothetical protein C8R46DRAFT_921661 [Mycena filopes]|nr:hypothetical protein C8R46DRAFT_921661 [Mycena filopes]